MQIINALVRVQLQGGNQHFQVGVTRALLTVIRWSLDVPRGEGDDAIAAVEGGRTSPLDLHHVQAHRWNQSTLWMLLPVMPT